MIKNILLIEPTYRNKYPPLGLMKISAYHKQKGENVVFFKGLSPSLRNQRWDRIYVTTLFSFHWKKTIETIQYYKRSVKKVKDFYIGGIMSTIMADEIMREVGVRPYCGLLNRPGILGEDNIIVDELTPDYDILDEIEYEYPASNSYITYTTRGCVNKCKFCAVPLLEPEYHNYISISDQIKEIEKKHGTKKDLLLMDNNVMASKKFDQIIDDIISLGYGKGAKYSPPNYFELYYKRFLNNTTDLIAKKKIFSLLVQIKNRVENHKINSVIFSDILIANGIDLFRENPEGDFSQKIKAAYDELSPFIEKVRNKSKRNRYIDFNQGIDARLLTEEKMKRLSEININPLRIAFDNIKFKDLYFKKVRLAAKYEITRISNYLLYNFNDTPEELYERLKINIDLNQELGIQIFSFPMKYIPVNAKDRSHIDRNWNRKYLRTIQVILNVTHGAVMHGREFFERAFGGNIDEFKKILLMPEDYIYYRNYCEVIGLTDDWNRKYSHLQYSRDGSLKKVTEKIFTNRFRDIAKLFYSEMELNFLQNYRDRVDLNSYRKWRKNKLFQQV